eukprot:CAMPEP_0173130778 /NCGR_PEP_ID=MMETSP1102-20130122/60241_1 /TAXON_ID=49646 /ORGANISM="Geminigera sp., Strain Caron Lab Isolate" /LENGTH=405 /DNA_ID=CAMNT_0014041955 /DNA_START=48 /DNA_END=1261 /DNA_ORIENTATION=+
MAMSRSTCLMLTLLLTSFCFVSLTASKAKLDAFRKNISAFDPDPVIAAAWKEAERVERVEFEQETARLLALEAARADTARLLAEQQAAEELAQQESGGYFLSAFVSWMGRAAGLAQTTLGLVAAFPVVVQQTISGLDPESFKFSMQVVSFVVNSNSSLSMLEPTNTMDLCDIQMQALQFCVVFGTLCATFACLTTRDNCNVVIMRKSHIHGSFPAENVTSKMDFGLFSTDEHAMMPRWTHVTVMSVVMCLCLFVHASLGFVLCGVVASLYFVGFASSRWSDMFSEVCNMQSCLTETFKCLRLMLGTLLTLSVETVATSCVCMWWYVLPSLFEVAPGASRVTIQYKVVPSALHEVYLACVGSAPEAWLVFQDSDVLIALLLFKFATDLVLVFDARESKIVCVPSFV